MKLTELAVLLPCHSLEDFPVYHEGREADELLTAWTAPWHPALLAAAGGVPVFHRVDMPPESLAGRLISLPPFAADQLPAGYLARAEHEAAGVVCHAHRPEAVDAALAALGSDAPAIDPELVADYLALGFCRLQIELLTRQMRYSVNIDETHFAREAVAGAVAAAAGNVEQAREHLRQCYETLHEARNRFYPVDVYLIDLLLVADIGAGADLAGGLGDTPTNVLLSMGRLDRLPADEPETWSHLLAAIDQGTAHVVGGEVRERALPLLPLETILATLIEGVRTYEKRLGRLPHVYGRRRAGLWPGLPQLLVKLGYQGALHFTMDDGRFPVGTQAKTRWEGLDASTIDALCHPPSDVARAETFLGLSRKMAETMDNDHVATLVFARWPGDAGTWYGDLRRIARHSGVLGKFMLLDDYFAHTDMPGRLSKHEADRYRSPYLKQAIMRKHSDAISAVVRQHTAQAHRSAAHTFETLACLAAGHDEASGPSETDADTRLAAGIDRLARSLPRGEGKHQPHYVALNAHGFSRAIGVELVGADASPQIGGAVLAAGTSGDRHFAVVETPAMGFAWVTPCGTSTTAARAKPIAHDNKLSNEFLELEVSTKTGGIKSLYDYARRGNQLSQQLAVRLDAAAAAPDAAWQGDDDAAYTTMRAEHVETTLANPAVGEITSRGTLCDLAGTPLTRFRQTVRVWAARPVIELDIELDAVETLRADPWNSYLAARFAWPDRAADLWRGVGLTRQRTEATRLEAPEYIEIEGTQGNTTILTGGLPYHRRAGERMLDSLLVVRGERARRFRLGIGVSLPHPADSALELLTDECLVPVAGAPPATATGWFFHISAKNVLATHWEPLWDDPEPAHAPRRAIGFRARLVETSGKPGRVTLHTFRPVARARQVDFLGQTLVEASVDGDKIRLDFASREWIEVEAAWAG